MSNPMPSNVFAFSNYREFLKDRYQQLKVVDPNFSHRTFSRDAGLGSPNYLKLVMDGDRDLGPKALKGFTVGLRLNAIDTLQFIELVQASWKEKINERYHVHLHEVA